MPSLLTYCTLFVTAIGALVLRLLWPRLTLSTRRTLRWLASFLLLLSLVSAITKWHVTNHRVGEIEAWLRIVACQFAIVFFTLLRPRLLTVPTAAVLLLLTFGTMVTGPLSGIFRRTSFTEQHIADRYYLDTIPWQSDGPGANSGVDFDLYYKPSPTAHLRRSIYGTRLYDSQCRTASTYATLSEATHTITVHCPRLSPANPDATESGMELRYFIPHGALSPELLRQWREDPQAHQDEERSRQ